VKASTENYRLQFPVEFNQQTILPTLRFEAKFLDPLGSGLSFHLVSEARPIGVVPALPGFFEN
jgi:hypothetical protein